MRVLPSLLVLGLAIGIGPGIGGCSAQVEPSYPGEPLATVKGTVTTTATPPAKAIDAAILWLTRDPAKGWVPKLVGERVPVSATFPAAFTLSAFSPPPAAAVGMRSPAPQGPPVGPETPSDPRPTGVWTGFLVALASDANIANVLPSDVLGVDTHHMVVYFDHDGRPGLDQNREEDDVFLSAGPMRVPATKGYHLVLSEPGAPAAREAYDRCTWNELCVRGVSTDPVQQDYYDWRLARCTALFTETCTYTDQPTTAEEEAENARCLDLQREAGHMNSPEKNQNSCLPFPRKIQPNPDGFDSPSTIELGTAFWAAHF
jgi:hypothetical protein